MLTRRWFRGSAGRGGSAASLLAAPAAARSGRDGLRRREPEERPRQRRAAWKADAGKEAVISYAASSALAKQIEEGAPADVFISADLDWMDYLSERNLIPPGHRGRAARQPHRADRAGGSAATTEIAPGFDLAGLLGDGRLAMAKSTRCRPASTARRR